MKTYTIRFLLIAVVVGLATPAAWAAPTASAGQWDEDTLRLFAEIPILEGGRVKPLDTYAAFTLLRLNGKRFYVLRDAAGERTGKLTPLEWLLDCLFYPEVAANYKTIRIDDSEILRSIGVTPTDDRQDYYSYTQLMPGFTCERAVPLPAPASSPAVSAGGRTSPIMSRPGNGESGAPTYRMTVAGMSRMLTVAPLLRPPATPRPAMIIGT